MKNENKSDKSDKEISIKLEDEKPTSYAKSFKNYAFKTYDEGAEDGGENEEYEENDIEITDLKINLNPCLPGEPAFRKSSSNSQTLHKNIPLQACDGVEGREVSVQKSITKSKFNTNPHFKSSNMETASDSAIKTKRKRLNTGSSTSNTSLTKAVGKRKKYYKKSRKTSISNNEFNTFFVAFEQHSKLKMDSSNLTASGEQESFSSAKVSPEMKANPKKNISNS